MTRRRRIAAAAPAVLTGDELRALARARGWTLPPALLGDEPGDDEPDHDIVAVRGLLARGVVAFTDDEGDGDGLTLTSPTQAVLAPLDAVERVVEVDVDTGEARHDDGGRHVLVTGPHGTLCLSEALAEVWSLAAPDTVDAVLAEIRAALAAAPRPAPGPDHAVHIDGTTHAWVDAARAGADALAAVLAGDGATTPAAAVALADALVAADRVSRVRVAARHDDPDRGEGLVAAEACWIEAPSGWWSVAPATVDEDALLVPITATAAALPGDPATHQGAGADDGGTSTFTPTDPSRVLALLDDVLATGASPA